MVSNKLLLYPSSVAFDAPRDRGRSYWQLARSTPATALSRDLPNGLQERLVNDPSQARSVYDIWGFLHGGHRPRHLRKVFNTDFRREKLLHEYRRFESTARAWLDGDRRQSQFTWIVPAPVLDGLDLDAPHGLTDRISDCIRHDSDLRPADDLLAECAFANRWLPLLSLQGGHTIFTMHAPQRNEVGVAVAKAARSWGASLGVQPWDDSFPELLDALPVSSLVAYHRTDTVVSATRRLEGGGICNVGHLVALCPEALDFLAFAGESVLTRIYRRLLVCADMHRG